MKLKPVFENKQGTEIKKGRCASPLLTSFTDPQLPVN